MTRDQWNALKTGDTIECTGIPSLYEGHFTMGQPLTVVVRQGPISRKIYVKSVKPGHACTRDGLEGLCGAWGANGNFSLVQTVIPEEEMKNAQELPKSVNPDDVMGFFT